MKKSILNLSGAQELSKNEQKSVNGGTRRPYCNYLGDTGVRCTTEANCKGTEVCFNGCCNSMV